MNSTIQQVQNRLSRQNLTMAAWAAQEGFSRQVVHLTLKRWAGRNRQPHGGIAREIMTRLEKTLADPDDEPAPAMCTLAQAERLAVVRQFLGGAQTRTEAEAVAQQAGIHVATLYRWIADARAAGADTVALPLADAPVTVKFPRTRCNLDLLGATVGWLLAHPRASLQDGHAQLVAQCTATPAPSYVQFTRLLKEMQPSFADLKRLQTAGSVPLRLTKTPQILRRWSDLPAGHTYVGDQHLLDYQCVLPETGEIVNLQLYLWMDAATTYWTGLVGSYGPYTQYTVGLSLLDSCRLHIPTALLNDNGRQERSAYVNDLWARLAPQIDVDGSRHFTTPNLPPVKPIEAQMSVLTTYLNQEGLTGYRKRDGDAFTNKQRQGALAKAKKAAQLPPLDELLQTLIRVMTRHNTTPCRSEVDGAEYIPAERFHQGLHGRRIVLPDADLIGLFFPRFERKVRNACVRIKIGGNTLEFTDPKLALIPSGESVQVLINPLPPHDGSWALRDRGEGEWEPYCSLDVWQGRGVAPYAARDTLEALMKQKQSYLNQFRAALKQLHDQARATFAPDSTKKDLAKVLQLPEIPPAQPLPTGIFPNVDAPAESPRETAVVLDHQAALRALVNSRRRANGG